MYLYMYIKFEHKFNICFQHASFFIFLVSVELIVGVGGAVISAWVGGGSELRVQFYRNVTSDEDVANHHGFWDHLQSEVLF